MANLDHEARSQGIGASEIANLTRYRKWSTPLRMYAEKTGKVAPSKANLDMRLGTMMEPIIAEMYSEQTGLELVGDGATSFVHCSMPWLRCTPDRIVADNSRLIETKYVRSIHKEKWGDPGTDQVPPHILLQAQYQCLVTAIPLCVVVALFDDSDEVLEYPIRHDNEIAESLTKIATDFWHKHVLADVPPEPDWSHPDEPKLVIELAPVAEDRVASLNGVHQVLFDEYQKLGNECREFEKRRKELKGRLVQALDGCREGILPDGTTVYIQEIQGYAVAARFQEGYRKLAHRKSRKGM